MSAMGDAQTKSAHDKTIYKSSKGTNTRDLKGRIKGGCVKRANRRNKERARI